MPDIDRDLLTAALGESAREFLLTRARSGASNETLIDEIATRTHGLIRLTPNRLAALLQRMEGPAEQASRRAPLPAAAAPGRQAPRPAPRTPTAVRRSAAPTSPPAHARSAEAARRLALRTERWLTALEDDLDGTLGSSSREFILRRARIDSSRGMPEERMLHSVTRALLARGAWPDLIPEDVRRLLLRHGWRTAAALEAERLRARRSGSVAQGESKGRSPSSFWARIATERHVRQVSGGLPTLGKRT